MKRIDEDLAHIYAYLEGVEAGKRAPFPYIRKVTAEDQMGKYNRPVLVHYLSTLVTLKRGRNTHSADFEGLSPSAGYYVIEAGQPFGWEEFTEEFMDSADDETLKPAEGLQKADVEVEWAQRSIAMQEAYKDWRGTMGAAHAAELMACAAEKKAAVVDPWAIPARVREAMNKEWRAMRDKKHSEELLDITGQHLKERE